MSTKAFERSIEEIKARIQEVKDRDWMGVITSDLMVRLPFEHAKQFCKEGTTREQFEAHAPALSPLEAIKDYLPFAWEKAIGRRGLSAGRSLDHMDAWLWLAGRDDLCERLHSYRHYGKAQLVMCSVLVGFPWQEHDDGEWVNDEGGPSIDESEIAALAEEFAGYALAERPAVERRADARSAA